MKKLMPGILLLGISFLLWNCQKEESQIYLQTETTGISDYEIPSLIDAQSSFELLATQTKTFKKTSSKGKNDFFMIGIIQEPLILKR